MIRLLVVLAVALVPLPEVPPDPACALPAPFHCDPVPPTATTTTTTTTTTTVLVPPAVSHRDPYPAPPGAAETSSCNLLLPATR